MHARTAMLCTSAYPPAALKMSCKCRLQVQHADSDMGAIAVWQQRAQRSYGLSPDPHIAALEHSSATAAQLRQAPMQSLTAQTPLFVGPPQNIHASLRTGSCDAERCASARCVKLPTVETFL